MSYNQSLLPNKVGPGVSKYVDGAFEYTKANYIRNIGLTHPEILEGTYRYFSAEEGMLSTMLRYMDSTYNPAAAKKLAANGTKELPWEKKVKYLSNYQYQWMVNRPEGWVYTILEAPAEDPQFPGTVGANDKEFSFIVSERLISKDDVLMLKDLSTQIIVTREPQSVPGLRGRRITCKLMNVKGLIGQRIPLWKLAVGAEVSSPKYNLKPESSDNGSKFMVQRGEWYRGWMSTLRLEYSYSGMLGRTELKGKDAITLVYDDGVNTPIGFWMTIMDKQMMKEKIRIADNHCFWGMPNINQDGNFRTDNKNRTYYSGAGIYHQANKQLRVPYQNLNDFSIIDRLTASLYVDWSNSDNEGTKPTILALGGLQFRTDFDKLIRNEFSLSPQVLWYDGTGNLFGAPKGETKVTGIRSDFNYYETPNAVFVVANCRYFDSKWNPTNINQFGQSMNSKRAILCNISKSVGGDMPISLLSVTGANAEGEISSIANNGGSGDFATPVDGRSKHMMMAQGVALHNPNSIAEMYATDPRNS